MLMKFRSEHNHPLNYRDEQDKSKIGIGRVFQAENQNWLY